MRTIALDRHWSLEAHSHTTVEAKALPPKIPMMIPGDIAGALLEAGFIDDPYYGRNELEVLWIGQTDWVLSREFNLETLGPESAILEFEFLDTVADIRLNGTIIGQGCNMFRRYRFDAADTLKTGTNRLEVIIKSPEIVSDEAALRLPYPIPHAIHFPWQWKHRNLLRKPACHGGWDWGLSLMTGGIYSAPKLHLGGAGLIDYVTTRQQKRPGCNQWELTVAVDYQCRAGEDITLEYRLDHQFSQANFSLEPGNHTLEHSLVVEDPELWWPAGYGESRLYHLEVRSPHELVTKKIGFRTVEVVVEDDDVGRSMFFRINGRDIFAKGANWIPVDAFPSRQGPEVYRRLLEDARAAHMNMIRIWGGGQYEHRIFYELCDELGLMVWHDMMFACSLYPADKEFLNEVDGEIRHQIKRLKDHPSIVLWCGNNENLGALNESQAIRENRDRYLVDYDRLNEGIIGRAVKELDPTRTWWPSSPSAGEGDYSDCWHEDSKGDMHYWSVWHEGREFEAYYEITPRFCSEFGFQSFPSARTVASYAPEGERSITSPVMRHHQKNKAGNSIILSTMARYFRLPSNSQDILWLSQVQQAWAIRIAVDYWRSRRPVSMGALYWQLNDLWPVASWSSIEYDGTWKLLHYEARRFFAPVNLSIYKKDGHLHVYGINDTERGVSGRLIVRLLSYEGVELEGWDLGDLFCPPGTAISFWQKSLNDLRDKAGRTFQGAFEPHDVETSDMVAEGFTRRFIVAEWEAAGVEKMLRSLFLTEPRDCELAHAVIRVTPESEEGVIKLTTDKPAFFVTPECGIPGSFDDAGFTLLPGRPRILKFHPADSSGLPKDFPEQICIHHLRKTY